MNTANKITIFRILSIPFFIACLLYYSPARPYLRFAAFIIFAVAAFTDALDGGIARSRNQITELGIALDPIADKLLITSAFISLSVINTLPEEMKIPAWAALAVISRDVIIVVGSLLIYVLKGDVSIKPSPLGKITTFFQMASILSVLTVFNYRYVFIYPAIILTVLSGIDYIWKGSRQLNEA